MLKECCSYFSYPLDVYEASSGRSPWTSRHCCRNSSKKLQQVIINKKKIENYLLPAWKESFKEKVRFIQIITEKLNSFRVTSTV